MVTRWLAELLGLPAGTAAVFVTGAAMANTAALTAARDHQLARAGWDVQADGLFGAPELTVVVGEQAHATLIRALGLIGLGRGRVRRVRADDQGRMRADRLPADVAGPVLNQVLVRAATDELTLALVDAVQQDRTCWCGPTTWQHRPAMRISVSGWATSGEDVTKSAEAIIAAAGRLSACG